MKEERLGRKKDRREKEGEERRKKENALTAMKLKVKERGRRGKNESR